MQAVPVEFLSGELQSAQYDELGECEPVLKSKTDETTLVMWLFTKQGQLSYYSVCFKVQQSS